MSQRRFTSRYVTPKGPEAQWQPGSHGRVLRNLLGIRRKTEMDHVELDAMVRAQTKYLARIGPDTRLTASLLCQMHRGWLGDIYEWAGRYRTVELAKAGFQWPPAFRVPANMESFEKATLGRCTPCLPGPLVEVAGRVARVHADLLLIYPFRDGNGRLARWVADLMALQAGLPAPDYAFIGRGAKASRAAYLDAVRSGYLADYDPLEVFFVAALRRRLGQRP